MDPINVSRPIDFKALRRLIEWLFLAVGLLALPTMTWAQPMTTWDRGHPLPARFGPFGFSSTRVPANGDSDGNVILHVKDAQGRTTDLTIEIAYDDVYVTLGIGRIDPESPNLQLLVTSYTGGAHCCVHIQILDDVDGQWRTLDIGAFDGEPIPVFPTDIDGDGITDIERADDRFAYAFGCYASSWMPPRIFNIRRGKVQDVSGSARYRKLYVKDFKEAKSQCVKHANPACAGMVADSYRLGGSDKAWSVAMVNIDRDDGWLLPGCKVKPIDNMCPEDQQFHSGEFRAALTQFLIENGIAPNLRGTPGQIPRGNEGDRSGAHGIGAGLAHRERLTPPALLLLARP